LIAAISREIAPCAFPVAIEHLIASFFHKHIGVIIAAKENGYYSVNRAAK